MPRLLVYLIEANAKSEPERSILLRQLKMMASRLWFGIAWPSAIITLGMGAALIVNQPEWLEQSFMHIKLTLVLLLYVYHLTIHKIHKQIQNDVVHYTSQQLRVWNEVATLFLISIVFIIVLKNALSMAWGIAGLAIVTVIILLGMRLYKRYRKHE
jgi:putative membrane protein